MGFQIDSLQSAIDSIQFCSLCNNVVQSPKGIEESKCEKVFCKDCLQECPNTPNTSTSGVYSADENSFSPESNDDTPQFLQEMFSKLKVRCSFWEKCNFIGPITEVERHDEKCKYNPSNFEFCSSGQFILLYLVKILTQIFFFNRIWFYEF